jgi:hypothetical protein
MTGESVNSFSAEHGILIRMGTEISHTLTSNSLVT